MQEILRLIKDEVCMGTYGLVELELRKLVDGQKSSHSNASTKLRKIIIELGCRGVLGASERDTAIVDEICKREGIVL